MGSLSLVQRLGVLGGVGVLAAAVSGAAGVVAVRRYDTLIRQLEAESTAQRLVRELDTRASELKVDGFKALVRPDVAEEKAELQDDNNKITQRLDALRALPLEASLKLQVETLSSSFTIYSSKINDVVAAAVSDQEAARGNWEKIQEANDATDEVVGTAIEVVDAAATRTERSILDLGTRLTVTVLAVVVGGGLAVLALTGWFAQVIKRRVGLFVRTLAAASTGDLSARMGDTSTDEFGSMGVALDTLLDRLAVLLQAIARTGSTLVASSEQALQVASEVAGSARTASGQAQLLASSAADVSNNVQTVAAAAQEMGASIGEIARNAQEAAHVATGAVQAVDDTTVTMGKLGESSQEIGTVIRLITSIAEQTNLLALNATIEAARAGAAGKGFAVVADEVKQLAQETARATEDISRRVETIQADAERASAAIGDIAGVIARINEYQTTIAGAVEEQTATTQEMNSGINDAAQGSSRIAESVGGIADATGRTASAVESSQRGAAELERMGAELREAVGSFRF
ncbi:MAG: methyl-accepting chemotaxis protein [Actinomycetota bacterium]|nr:methyl-accepting chemotaxis protein [Actinomycetota bacterium]